MELGVAAYAVVIAIITLLYFRFLHPIVKFVLRQRTIGRELAARFPSWYDDSQFHWLYGNDHKIPPGEQGLAEVIRRIQEYPRVGLVYLGSLFPSLLITHPETAKVVLRSAGHKKHALGRLLTKCWLGDGLVMTHGEKWFRNRRLLTPAFHFDILKPYVQIYNNCADKLMNNLRKACETGNSTDVVPIVSMCTFEIILKCAFSCNDEIQQGANSPYVDATAVIMDLFLRRARWPWLWIDAVYNNTSNGRKFKAACDLTRSDSLKVMTMRREQLQSQSQESFRSNRKYLDFVDILLMAKDEEGNPMTDAEILDEVSTFMFAGLDTTKSAISFTLYCLAKHADAQARARLEVQELLKGRESEAILWGDLSKFTYLTQCIKEALRMFPPLPQFSREVVEPFDLDGQHVPEGTPVEIMVYAIHHNPAVWGENRMEYDPNRFSEENMIQMDSHAFIPFSAGPRNCIGQHFAMDEIKVILARLLNRFELSVDNSVDVIIDSTPIMRAEHGIFLNFIPLT